MSDFSGVDAFRRDFLLSSASGLGALAFSSCLGRDGLMAADPVADRSNPLSVRAGHFPATAKRCIFVFLAGAPSQIDLLDPKPILNKLHLQKFPGKIKYDNAAQASSKVLHSPWKFRPRGQSGIQISELLPHTAGIVDDLCLIRSMQITIWKSFMIEFK